MVPTEEMLTAPQTHGSIWKAILRERCPSFFFVEQVLRRVVVWTEDAFLSC